jgi:hypothetical protein
MTSDLPRSRAQRRAPAISFGGTRTTCSPRASRKRSSAPETCRQSSIAHTRSPPRARAHTSRSSNARRLARPVTSAIAPCACPLRSRSSPPVPPRDWDQQQDHGWTHLSRGDATLLSSHAGDPRTAAGDTTTDSQTPRSTPGLRVSPPPNRGPTGRAGRHRPTRRLSH